ncbi:hypothetical protein AB3K92_10695 [Burkholderia sp. Bmkn7]|uniref:hypothetical protein n=1 Tax=Burkholderia sp. Bmkn7 TaxID=3236841 RepID=UPI0034E3F84D
MSEIIYRGFYNNWAIYRANRAYWFGRFWSKHKGGGDWSKADDSYRRRYKPYLSDRFNNGVFFLDGNPIFNLWNVETGKVARVVQLEAEGDDDRYFHSFTQKIEMAPIGYEEIHQLDELVVILVLSTGLIEQAVGELREWLR